MRFYNQPLNFPGFFGMALALSAETKNYFMQTQKIPFEVLILESDDSFRSALEKELKRVIERMPLKVLYHFNFHVYDQPGAINNNLDFEKKDTSNFIAFVNHQFEKSLFENFLSANDTDKNQKLKSIILASTDEELKESRKYWSNKTNFDFIVKNDYTLCICGVLFEQYLANSGYLGTS
jgi:hypothetical protein